MLVSLIGDNHTGQTGGVLSGGNLENVFKKPTYNVTGLCSIFFGFFLTFVCGS